MNRFLSQGNDAKSGSTNLLCFCARGVCVWWGGGGGRVGMEYSLAGSH